MLNPLSRRWYLAPAACALALAVAPESGAEEGKFDAQVFKPTAAPRDLMVVQKTEIIGHMSPTFALHSDMSLDPLVLVHNVSGQDIRAVGARLNISGAAGIGLFDIADLQLVMPFVAWQDSDNQRPLGVEGEIDTYAVGDLRLSGRLSLGFVPFFKRLDEDKGFAMAVRADLNLPTGSVDAFTSDGVLTGGGAVIADYRLPTGGVVSANLGLWLRPEREFAGVRIGDMASFGLAAETYVKRSWGLSILGGAYGYPSLRKFDFADSARSVPLEGFLAMRHQSSYGMTYTFGGSFGAACGFGKPAIRLFGGVAWTPSWSAEQEAIDRILRRDTLDPDHDGLISERDECPEEAGPVENRGCPDTDGDGDGWVDRVDECPTLPGGERGQKGCPPAYIRGDQIVILEKVYFATNSHEVLPESLPILEDVARVLEGHPEVQRLNIEGHTDIRAGDEYNLALSQRRVNSVTALMVGKGVDPRRLEAKGYGHMRPLVDDTHCNAPDEQLGPECKFLTSQNRRVVFRITHRCPALGKDAQGGPACPSARLEGEEIITLDNIIFEPGTEQITMESRPLLDDVVAVLNEHPEIESVRVEGHTSVLHRSDADRRLSRKRAKAVEDYLVAAGIAPKRLESVGYGHRRPDYDDSACVTPEAAGSSLCQFVTFKNHRIGFRILRWGVRPTDQKTR